MEYLLVMIIGAPALVAAGLIVVAPVWALLKLVAPGMVSG
jgi:hypothetical protein